ncbi:hypothetical protein, partial [Arachidicoccus sp.]|uniref:hypothetical protein n=1 Tax=Arachidicoccus sp. TaxID=1872624 RepID=UPI003D1C50F2
PMGRPKKLTKRDVRRMKRHVVKEVQSGHRVISRSVKENLDLDKVSRWTIQRELTRNDVLYKVTKKKLPLTKKHKKERLNFARRHLEAGTNFDRWIFSDEKRFNLDGPDNLGSYGAEYAQLHRIKRQMGGGSVMVLGAISSKGNLLIKVSFWSYVVIFEISKAYFQEVSDHYKAVDYILDLRTSFSPWARREMGKRGWTWQQDGSRVHWAQVVRDGFFEEEVATTEWPAYTPD